MIKNKKILIISVVSIVVIAASASAYFLLFNKKDADSNSVPSDSNSVTDKNQPITDGTSSGEDKVITPSPSNNDTGTPPEKPSVTRAEQSGSNIRVSAIFTKSSSGDCLLTLEKSGETTVTKTAAIIVGPSYYTCNGFLVPRSELGAAGEWTATVTHRLDGKSTVSDTKMVTVQ